MKKVYVISFLLSVFAIGAKPVDRFPQAEITNELIHARFYLPDAKDGYYRGSRFDWSGVMPELEYQGHTCSDNGSINMVRLFMMLLWVRQKLFLRQVMMKQRRVIIFL